MNMLPVSSLAVFDDEPRLRDVDLAAWLGFSRPTDIRELIARNRDEMSVYGGLPCRTDNPGNQGGRPGNAYYLNERQALVICALSRTPKAVEVRKALIDVFQAYHTGKLVQVAEHRRRLPNRHRGYDTFDANMRFVRAFSDNKEAMLELMAGTMTRLDQLEAR